MKKRNIGSTLESFLKDEGIAHEAKAVALKRILAWQLREAMRAGGITKVEMARRMRTSRNQLDRILDPENDRIRLDTLYKAAHAIGRELDVRLV